MVLSIAVDDDSGTDGRSDDGKWKKVMAKNLAAPQKQKARQKESIVKRALPWGGPGTVERIN